MGEAKRPCSCGRPEGRHAADCTRRGIKSHPKLLKLRRRLGVAEFDRRFNATVRALAQRAQDAVVRARAEQQALSEPSE